MTDKDEQATTRARVVADLTDCASLYAEAAEAVASRRMDRAARLLLAAGCKSDSAAHVSMLLPPDVLVSVAKTKVSESEGE